ncbi:MAG TPA: isoprenylcysteine carboxylmethyltransferase family protein [Candidatus Limnocylindrales bacterium]|nr:isoprenylcysteine carboxylmethyltransferase family protein [Candidatus Limnocylindrales bacterium]
MRGPNATTTAPTGRRWDLKKLVGSGDLIALFALPFIIGGVAIHIANPTLLAVDATSGPIRAIAIFLLTIGVLTWAWSVGLILSRVPKGELITTGPYAVVKHPLYTSVGLLVLPALGVLLGTWLGALIGVPVYVGSRLFAPAEEAELRKMFGAEWDAYTRSVKLPWL